jgi:hypothetical protein
MRFFHGSAQFDSIMKDGLVQESDYETDFSDDNRLVSLGGIYVTNNPEVAAFYAEMASQSEQSLGMDPCIFEVRITHHDLVADEDKLWAAIQRNVLSTFGLQDEEGGFSEIDIEDILAEYDYKRDDLVRQVAYTLQTSIEHEEDETLHYNAIKAFVLRSMSYEWDPSGENAEDVTAINELCKRARAALTVEWCQRNAGSEAVTARTLSPVGSMSSDNEVKIIGYAKLVLSDNGLAITGIDYGGTLSLDDGLALQAAFIEQARERGVAVDTFEPSTATASFG